MPWNLVCDPWVSWSFYKTIIIYIYIYIYIYIERERERERVFFKYMIFILLSIHLFFNS